MHELPAAPGALLLTAAGFAALALLCLLAAAITGTAHAIRTRHDRRADRALHRLARKAPAVKPHILAADDPQRSPEWCHRHNCHSSQCPGGH